LSVLSAFLVLLLLIGVFGVFNYLRSRKREAVLQAWFAAHLPPGVSLEAFLRSAPYDYRQLVDRRAFGIWDKRKGDNTPVNVVKTEEEAQAWIVAAVLNEAKN
jgi:hypothetical protein